MTEDWKFLAQRISGDGVPGEWLSKDLPLSQVTTTEVLTGPPLLTATIEPAFRRLKGPDQRPLLEYGSTIIYAVASGTIRGTGIYRTGSWNGPKWQLNCAGFTAYPAGMGYEAEASFVQIDPLDVVRHIWRHLQIDGERSNLGLVVDSATTTPVRVGWPSLQTTAAEIEETPAVKAAKAVKARLESAETILEDWTWENAPQEVEDHNDLLVGGFLRDGGVITDRPAAIVWLDRYVADRTTGLAAGEAGEGPFELNPWTVDDLGAVIDDLARSTPFEYVERHRWNQLKTEVEHELVFGYPRLGVRRENLIFRTGDGGNIVGDPTITAGEDHANHVRFIGAGEGRNMILEEARVDDGRPRKMVTVEDKSVRSKRRAQDLARGELVRRQSGIKAGSITIRNTRYTPLGSFTVGDEIRLQGEVDWMPIDLWFRVLSTTVSPDSPELMTLQLLRSDLVV